MAYKQDHKISTYFDELTGNLTSLVWKNHLDQQDAPGDFPAKVVLSSAGIPVYAFWQKRGKMHRDNDLPAAIYFDDIGRPSMWCWYQHGNKHREGGKPALIGFIDGSRTALTGIEFCRHGEPYRAEGGEAKFEFDPDGTAYNPNGEVVPFEGYDESWLPSPIPTLGGTPQPYLLNIPALKF